MSGLGFVGCGNMGEALLRGILAARLVPPGEICLFDVREERTRELARRHGAVACADLGTLVQRCDALVLAVKPQAMPGVIGELSRLPAEEKLLLSVAAGVPVRAFLAALGEGARVVRAMPNTPALVGAGCTGLYFSPGVPQDQRDRARAIFASVGVVVELPREELLDAVTALSGSGPAYAFLFIEALADGGVRAGIPREEALRLAAATVEGAARMVRETGRHPGELKDMVTSPGGTTAAGLMALEAGAFRGTVMQAVHAAWLRCRELFS